MPGVARPPQASAATDGLWRPFDPAALGGLVHDGHVVFVDVTADWCLTCKVNERLVLDAARCARGSRTPGVVAMRADWTRPDAAIAPISGASAAMAFRSTRSMGRARRPGWRCPSC